jgi:membrane-associated protein
LAGIYNRDLIENILFIENDFINVALLNICSIIRYLVMLLVIGLVKKVAIICTTSKIDFLVQKKIFGSVQRFFEKYGGKAIISLVFFQYFELCAYSCWNRFYG